MRRATVLRMWARWLLAGLGIVLGLVLIAKDDVLIGGIILAMALIRVVIFLQWQQRRREFRERFPHGRP
jgi:hypothetical protein